DAGGRKAGFCFRLRFRCLRLRRDDQPTQQSAENAGRPNAARGQMLTRAETPRTVETRQCRFLSLGGPRAMLTTLGALRQSSLAPDLLAWFQRASSQEAQTPAICWPSSPRPVSARIT